MEDVFWAPLGQRSVIGTPIAVRRSKGCTKAPPDVVEGFVQFVALLLFKALLLLEQLGEQLGDRVRVRRGQRVHAASRSDESDEGGVALHVMTAKRWWSGLDATRGHNCAGREARGGSARGRESGRRGASSGHREGSREESGATLTHGPRVMGIAYSGSGLKTKIKSLIRSDLGE